MVFTQFKFYFIYLKKKLVQKVLLKEFFLFQLFEQKYLTGKMSEAWQKNHDNF